MEPTHLNLSNSIKPRIGPNCCQRISPAQLNISRSLLFQTVFALSHLRQRYPSAMDMLLSLDSNRLVSIDYLGMFTRGFCTCESEEQARKIIRQANIPLRRALIWLAANISKLKDGFGCQYHLGEFKWRTVSCGCGSPEIRLKDMQTLRYTWKEFGEAVVHTV